jgi:hypothetical protein
MEIKVYNDLLLLFSICDQSQHTRKSLQGNSNHLVDQLKLLSALQIA